MNDKLELMKKAFDKIADEPDFIAFYLKKYGEQEGKTVPDLLSELTCSEEDFYKLALCKAPEPYNLKSREVLQAIAAYTNIDEVKISKLLQHVRTVLHFQNLGNRDLLMAARARNNK